MSRARTVLEPATALQRMRPIAEPIAEAAGPELAQRCWLVGGVVRDALLERPLVDVDVATADDPGQVARLVARHLGGSCFPLGDPVFATWRVAVGGEGGMQVDVSALRGGDGVEGDLRLRDLTINAIAVPLLAPGDPDGELLDVVGGIEDLRSGTVRAVSARSLDDDPLRLLRAARFAHQLSLDIDPETRRLVHERAARITEPAGERVLVELRQLLAVPEARRALRLLDDLRLLEYLLPELHACKGVAQSRFHHLDVYEHTLAVVDNVEDLLRAPGFWLGTPPGCPDQPFGDVAAGERALVLLLAAICHDLGKPATRAEHPGGLVSFRGHDAAGLPIVDAICGRWRTSARVRDAVKLLVRTHLGLGMLLHGGMTRRERWRYLRAVEPWAAEAVALSVADRLATAGPADRRRWVRLHLEAARTLWADWWAEQQAPARAPLLDGARIAEAAGIAPGPALGQLVRELAEEQGVGGVDTPEAAEQWVRQRAGELGLA